MYSRKSHLETRALKILKHRRAAEVLPRTTLGSLQRSPDPVAGGEGAPPDPLAGEEGARCLLPKNPPAGSQASDTVTSIHIAYMFL